jgi:hypothetical protein
LSTPFSSFFRCFLNLFIVVLLRNNNGVLQG